MRTDRRRFDTRWSLLHQLDDPLRVELAATAKPMEDYNNFYSSPPRA